MKVQPATPTNLLVFILIIKAGASLNNNDDDNNVNTDNSTNSYSNRLVDTNTIVDDAEETLKEDGSDEHDRLPESITPEVKMEPHCESDDVTMCWPKCCFDDQVFDINKTSCDQAATRSLLLHGPEVFYIR